VTGIKLLAAVFVSPIKTEQLVKQGVGQAC